MLATIPKTTGNAKCMYALGTGAWANKSSMFSLQIAQLSARKSLMPVARP